MAIYTPHFAVETVSNAVMDISDFGISDLASSNLNFALIVAEAGNLRYRFDGGDPTTAEGMLLKETDPALIIEGQARLAGLRMIRDGAVDVDVSITFDHRDR